MPLDPSMQRMLGRATRALANNKVEEAVGKIRAIIGTPNIPASEIKAQAAFDKLSNGDSPEPDELAALEIVIRLLRPAPLTHDCEIDDLPDAPGQNLYPQELKEQWSAFRLKVRPVVCSVGRIDLMDGTHVGTGFLVSDGVLATNRHVLDELSFGTGLLKTGRAQVLFKREQGVSGDNAHSIDGVVAIHPRLDIALLAVPKLGKTPVTIDTSPSTEGERVATIGYPARDDQRNPIFSTSVFGRFYGFKRAALGEVLAGTESPFLYHDCSTLGGNSGSPIFSLATGLVVGIHRSGYFMYRNEALDGASLQAFIVQH